MFVVSLVLQMQCRAAEISAHRPDRSQTMICMKECCKISSIYRYPINVACCHNLIHSCDVSLCSFIAGFLTLEAPFALIDAGIFGDIKVTSNLLSLIVIVD